MPGGLRLYEFSDLVRTAPRVPPLDAIVERSLNAVFVFRLDTLRFAAANRAALENTGYPLDELWQLTPEDLHADLPAGEYRRRLQALRDGTRDEVRFEGTHRRKDGSAYAVDERVFLIGDGFVSVVLDTSARVRVEQQRAELEAALRCAARLETVGAFARGIVHDLNNLLVPIGTHAELALEELAPEHGAREDLERIIETAARARQLVRDILSFARGSERDLAPVVLGKVVADALRLMQAFVPADIEIDARIDADCPPVLGDYGQLHQMVTNLCTNACTAMQASRGVITVRVEPTQANAPLEAQDAEPSEAAQVRLTVRDNGPGMDVSTLERIFEPYFSTGPADERNGLGLSVVRDVVSSHQGRITVDSDPGVGTTFRVYLPALRVPGEDRGPGEPREA